MNWEWPDKIPAHGQLPWSDPSIVLNMADSPQKEAAQISDFEAHFKPRLVWRDPPDRTAS
jgi:hypothetical protein